MSSSDGYEVFLKGNDKMGSTPYLSLLNLHTSATPVLQTARDVVQWQQVNEEQTLELLQDMGWREHLVALTTVYFDMRTEPIIDQMWVAFDQGS